MKLISDIWQALPFQVRVIAFAMVGVLIVLLVVLARIDGCRSRSSERKIDGVKTEILTDGVEANVLTNQKVEVEKNVNSANRNLGNVLGADTGNRDGNFGAVRERFCADHPNDSKCRR